MISGVEHNQQGVPLRRTRVTATAVAIAFAVLAGGFATSASAYYWLGNIGGFDYRDNGGSPSFTQNYVSNADGQGRRVCAGQSHSITHEWYGEYLCANGSIIKTYPCDYRNARAHNGETGTTYMQ